MEERKLVIDGNAVYEIDVACMRSKVKACDDISEEITRGEKEVINNSKSEINLGI